MRRATVPVDTSSEQKTIFGILSIRQLCYAGASGFIYYHILPYVTGLSDHWFTKFILALVIIIPFALFTIAFGFIRIEKYNMYLDRYLIVKLARKSQYGIWRKGGNY